MDELFKIFLSIKRRRLNSTKSNRPTLRIKRLGKVKRPRKANANYLKYKTEAGILAKKRLEYFNTIYHFKYNRVTIRNQKTRWGSCSKKGNLNFNYKIALLPPKTADYIIVHELCHIGEFNHSRNFWNLVAETMPDYKELRNSLRKISQIEASPLSGRSPSGALTNMM